MSGCLLPLCSSLLLAVLFPSILALILFAGGSVMQSGAVGVMVHLARAASAYRHPPEYLVLLRVSACLAHRVAQGIVGDYTTAALRAGASTVLKILDKNAAYSRYRHISSHRAAGPVRRALQDEHMHTHDCPACHGSSSVATGPSRWSVGRVLIPTTSAWKRAVRKRRREHKRDKEKAHHEETLDESAVYRHTRTHTPARCLEDRRCATSGVNEGAEFAHTRDQPAGRGYEVRELERDGDIRTDGEDDGYARAWMGGDGEKERERGKGKRRRAEHDERKEGRVRVRVRGSWERSGKARESALRILVVSLTARLDDVVELELVNFSLLPKALAYVLDSPVSHGVCGLHEARASLAPVLSPLELERAAGGVQGCGYAAHGFRNSSAGIAPLCKGVCIVNFLRAHPSSPPGLLPSFRRLSAEFSFQPSPGRS
ncbi:hypothetical protein B0H13DRAFT_1898191 [Mycena leptocephala]|nr:hypothetical protein B0H13DRAFT_1898191 [Mycena leptocephala]